MNDTEKTVAVLTDEDRAILFDSDGEQLIEVNLSGRDGNAFAILGGCQKAARRARVSKEGIDAILEEMKNGGYENLLQVAMKYFDVT